VLAEIVRHAPEDVHAPEIFFVHERSVVVHSFGGEDCAPRLAELRRFDHERAHDAEVSDLKLRAALHRFGEAERERARGRKISELRVVRTFVCVERRDELGNQKMKIRKSLAVSVARHVDGNAVDEERDVGSVIGVEAAQKILVGFPPPRVLYGEQTGCGLEHVGRPEFRP